MINEHISDNCQKNCSWLNCEQKISPGDNRAGDKTKKDIISFMENQMRIPLSLETKDNIMNPSFDLGLFTRLHPFRMDRFSNVSNLLCVIGAFSFSTDKIAEICLPNHRHYKQAVRSVQVDENCKPCFTLPS